MNSRRLFLQKLGGTAVALHLAPVAGWAKINNSQASYQGPVLRVAIMGLGGYSTRVAETMQSCKKAKLVGVISGTPSKINDWQNKFNIPAKSCYN